MWILLEFRTSLSTQWKWDVSPHLCHVHIRSLSTREQCGNLISSIDFALQGIIERFSGNCTTLLYKFQLFNNWIPIHYSAGKSRAIKHRLCNVSYKILETFNILQILGDVWRKGGGGGKGMFAWRLGHLSSEADPICSAKSGGSCEIETAELRLTFAGTEGMLGKPYKWLINLMCTINKSRFQPSAMAFRIRQLKLVSLWSID